MAGPHSRTLFGHSAGGLEGISLIDGSEPRSCSLRHWGAFRLTMDEALVIKRDFEKYAAGRIAEIEDEERSTS